MARYLLIESKSPWESGTTSDFYRLAGELAAAGHQVTLYLVESGVLAARAEAGDRDAEADTPLSVLADELSLRQRAMSTDELRSGVTQASFEHVTELLAAGARAIWH